MQTDECETRPNSNIQSRSDYSDIGKGFTEYESTLDKLKKANSISIRIIFSKYKINVNQGTEKICCPFKDHKGGKESTPSFMIYDSTNTFHCFGCHCSGKPVDFVSLYEKISKEEALNKLLSLVDNDQFMIDVESNSEEFNKKIQLLMSFSEEILTFKKKFIDKISIDYIENICKVYDNLNLNDNLSSQALNEVNVLMLKKINKYINEING